MQTLTRIFSKGGQKYLFTKRIFTENTNQYFGMMGRPVKQHVRMSLERIGENGNTLLLSKNVDGFWGRIEKWISRKNHINGGHSLKHVKPDGNVDVLG